MTSVPLRLLHPEWQGYGESPEVYHGAIALGAALFPSHPVVTIDAPEQEFLERSGDAFGLESIAPRFSRALAMLRHEAPERLVMVGGTCGTELAPVAYLNERSAGMMAVLWLDAHADLNTPSSSPSGHFHGMVLRTLLGDGPRVLTREIPKPLTPSQVYLVGARDLDPAEARFITETPIAHFGEEAFEHPPVLIERLQRDGVRQVYVHLDVDVIDPGSLSAALLRVPGGPASSEVSALIAAVHAEFDVVGFSVLEYCDRGPETERRMCDLLRAAGMLGASA